LSLKDFINSYSSKKVPNVKLQLPLSTDDLISMSLIGNQIWTGHGDQSIRIWNSSVYVGVFAHMVCVSSSLSLVWCTFCSLLQDAPKCTQVQLQGLPKSVKSAFVREMILVGAKLFVAVERVIGVVNDFSSLAAGGS
jgi:hypothetical protein